MAHTIITRQYLLNVIGLATDDQANAIIAKLIGALEYSTQFQPADIKMLCYSVRKTGGTIEVPDVASTNRNRRIPNLGHNNTDQCDTRIVLMAYGQRFTR